MALYKEIEQPDGVVCAYHRIVNLGITTNACNTVEVCSYISQAGREKERLAYEDYEAWDKVTPYTQTRFHEAPYDQDMTIASAYGWLKENVPEFEGAEDVM